MADLDWPDGPVPFGVEFRLQPHSGGTESPFSRQTKTYGLSAPRWICRLSVRGGYNESWGEGAGTWGEIMDAFLARLKGRQNRVRLYDFRRPGAEGPVNAEISQGDTTVTLTSGSVRSGGYVGGDGRPHLITAIDGPVLSVEPPFRGDVAAGAATFAQVTGYFRLTSDDAAANPTQVGELVQHDLDFVEDLGPAPLGEALGTIYVSTSIALESGHQFAALLNWKEGLKPDFSNLRIFSEDGETQLPFFLPPENIVAGTSAVAWIKFGAIDVGTRKLIYDGQAPSPQSNGYRTFDFFDDFSGVEIDSRKWEVALAGDGLISTQPRLRCKYMWSAPIEFAQCFAHVSPTRTIVANRVTDGEDGQLFMLDRQTGDILAGPVATGGHPWVMAYIPEKDYIAVSPAYPLPDSAIWVHRASDMSLVGKLYLEPEGSTTMYVVLWVRPNRILRYFDDGLTFQDYTVDWDALTATAGLNIYTVNGGAFTATVGQGLAYNPRNNRIYCMVGGVAGERALYELSFMPTPGEMANTARWRALQIEEPLDGTGEPEGLFIDRDGAMWHGGQQDEFQTFNMFQDDFSYPSREITLPYPRGRGAYFWTPPGIGNAASITSKVPLTGPTRVIFGIYGAAKAKIASQSGAIPRWGIVDAAGTRVHQFTRSGSTADSGVILDRRAPSKTTQQNAVAISAPLSTMATYELLWDGVAAKYRRNYSTLGTYTDTVVPVVDAALMTEAIGAATTLSNHEVGMLVYYVARAKLPASGVPEPLLTVE